MAVQMPHGLDRAPIHEYDPPGSPSSAISASPNSETEKDVPETNDSSDIHTSKRTRLKASAKRLFHIQEKSNPIDAVEDSSNAPVLAPVPESAQDDDRLVEDNRQPEHPPLKEMIKNPISTVQGVMRSGGAQKAAQTMHNTAISHGADVKLVKAHDKLESTESGSEKQDAEQELTDLKQDRQALFVRWTLDQHLRDVRVTPPKSIEWKSRSDFVVINEQGKEDMQWISYGQHVRGPLILRTAEQHCFS